MNKLRLRQNLSQKLNQKLKWVFILSLIMFWLTSCAGNSKPKPTADLKIEPVQFFLSPALFKKPVMVSGSGFKPNELVIIEMILPEGFKMKGIGEDERNVGIATGTAGADGAFKTTIKPTAVLNWFFQVGWTPMLKPDFKKAKPIPPGNYDVIATGMDSEIFGQAVMTIIPPPKK